MNSISLPLHWDPQQKVQFHCQILSNFLKISKSQKTRGGISVVIWTDVHVSIDPGGQICSLRFFIWHLVQKLQPSEGQGYVKFTKSHNNIVWTRLKIRSQKLWDFVNVTYPWPSEGCNFCTRCQIKILRLQIFPPWSINTCTYPQSFHTTSLEQYFCKKTKSLSWLRS